MLQRLVLLLLLSASVLGADLFDKQNLAAWCIVPFDAAKRGPEARTEMVAKMGLKKVAYDWRQEHVAEFEREILAYQKHGIEMFAFWGMHDEAFRLFEKYKLHPQLWIMMKGTGETQDAKVKSAAEGLLPILAKAKAIGPKLIHEIDWIGRVSERFTHFPSFEITNDRGEINILERKFIREAIARHDHTCDPEKDDIGPCD